jgi:dTDP-4-amino-4,6-dideoxygalactose transaminase
MDPESLKAAFGIYPDTKIVIINHLYGFPGQITAIKKTCEEHGAILIENASEAFGAKVDGKPVGTIDDIAVFDFGKDKIITGGNGGAIVINDENDSNQVRNWVTLSRKNLPWNHTETIGYDYQMSEISAAIILGQLNYLGEILDRKKQIYDIYQEHLNDELLYLIGSDENAEPNYWHSTVFIDSQIEADEKYTEDGYSYEDIHGTTSPMEVVDSLEAFGADAAPVYMPLSLQPAFSGSKLIGADGIIEVPKAYADDDRMFRDECSGDAFKRCVCLPADPSMTKEEQLKVIEIVHACFNKQNIDLGAFDAFE